MRKVNPDSYCGIYCGACSVSMHGETGRADGFVTCLRGVPKEEVACNGCKSDTVYAGCRVCALRDCAVEKGVAHCVDCIEYPCKMYRKWQSAAKLVPHVREATSSLKAIENDGVNIWLAAQQRRWSCPNCGAPFSWYAAECYKCGCKLASKAYAISGWKRLLFRFIFLMAYRKGKIIGR